MKNKKKSIGFFFLFMGVSLPFPLLPLLLDTVELEENRRIPMLLFQKSDSIFPFVLHAGENADSGIRVMNNTDEEKQNNSFRGRSETATGGAFSCKARTLKRRSGTWIALESNTVSFLRFQMLSFPFVFFASGCLSRKSCEGCLVLEDADQVPEEQGEFFSVFVQESRFCHCSGEIFMKKYVRLVSVSFRQKGEEETKYFFSQRCKMSECFSRNNRRGFDPSFFSWWNPIVQSALFPSQRRNRRLNFEIPSPFWGGIYRTESTFLNMRQISIFRIRRSETNVYNLFRVISFRKEEEKQYSIFSWNSSYSWRTSMVLCRSSPVAMAIEVFSLVSSFSRFLSMDFSLRKNGFVPVDSVHHSKRRDTPILADRYDVAWKIVAKGK